MNCTPKAMMMKDIKKKLLYIFYIQVHIHSSKTEKDPPTDVKYSMTQSSRQNLPDTDNPCHRSDNSVQYLQVHNKTHRCKVRGHQA